MTLGAPGASESPGYQTLISSPIQRLATRPRTIARLLKNANRNQETRVLTIGNVCNGRAASDSKYMRSHTEIIDLIPVIYKYTLCHNIISVSRMPVSWIADLLSKLRAEGSTLATILDPSLSSYRDTVDHIISLYRGSSSRGDFEEALSNLLAQAIYDRDPTLLNLTVDEISSLIGPNVERAVGSANLFVQFRIL